MRAPHQELPKVPERGAELISNSSGKTGVAGQGGAESGALGASDAAFGREMSEIIEAWPKLTADVREQIASIVRNAAR